MATNLKELINDKVVSLIIIIITGAVYLGTQISSPTPYNHFTRLAHAFINGKVCLENPPTYLELTGRDGDTIRCVPYPPMPAFVALPVVLLLGVEFSQTTVAVIFGSISVGLFFLISKRLTSLNTAIFASIALGIGTNYWYLATDGSSWYIAHVLAVFFICTALLVIQFQKNSFQTMSTKSFSKWFMAGLLIGAAYWSRLPAVLISPFFLYLALRDDWKNQKNLLNALLFSVGLGLFFTANMYYNYVRFQNPFENGYYFIQGVQEESWFSKGKINFSYLPQNIEFILFKMPPSYENFPYIQPSLHGMALWLTSPFLLMLPFALFKNNLTRIMLLVSGLMLGPGLLHGTPGFAQFGYRFAMEATPLFILAIILSIQHSKKLKVLFIGLLLCSIGINFWGIYYIRTLNIHGW